MSLQEKEYNYTKQKSRDIGNFYEFPDDVTSSLYLKSSMFLNTLCLLDSTYIIVIIKTT